MTDLTCRADAIEAESHYYIRHLEETIDRMHPVIIAALRTTHDNKWNVEIAATELCPAMDAYREACGAV